MKQKNMTASMEDDYYDDIRNVIVDGHDVIYSMDGKQLLKCEGMYLDTYTIREGTERICNRAFWGCKFLREIIIPESVKRIGKSAFENCVNLQQVIIPDSVVRIENSAFSGCRSLQEIKIPLIKKIENNVFKNCYNLRQVTIPNSVTLIGKDAFYKCSSLFEIRIPNSVITICDRAFYSCGYLNQVIITDSVKIIGNQAFAFCKRLQNVLMSGANLTTIGNNAFESCGSLREINIPDSIERIGVRAFGHCDALEQVHISGTNLTTIGNNAFESCGSLREINIPDSVEVIGDRAFVYCYSLHYFTIPASLIYFRKSLFDFGKNRFEIYFTSNSSRFIVRDGFIIDNQSHTIVFYFGTDEYVKVPDSIISVGDSAFVPCGRYVEKIEISDSVTLIGKMAFYHCGSLSEITIPNSVITIDYRAFAECYGLQQITIFNSITKITNQSFAECTSLRTISIPKTMISIADDAFEQCNELRSINLQRSNVKIKKIIINNFRAFRHAEFDLSDFNCIIGKNDTGKSTIYAALHWFFNADIKLDENDFAAACFNSGSSMVPDDFCISVDVYFSGEPFSINNFKYSFYEKDFLNSDKCICIRKYVYHPSSKHNGKRQGFLIKEYVFPQNNEKLFSEISIDDLKGKCGIENIPNDFWNGISLLEEQRISNKNEIIQHWYDYRIKQQLCDILYSFYANTEKQTERWADFDNEQSDPLHFDWFDSYKYFIYTSNAPLKNYLNSYFEIRFSDLIENAKSRMAYELSNEIVNNFRFKTNESFDLFSNDSLVFRQNALPINIPLTNRGDGFQLQIKNAMFKILAGIQSKNLNTIFAFEEPETHLHPSAQIEMYETIKELSENPNCQVFITTHSPYIVKELAKEKIKPIVVKQTYGSNESIIDNLSDLVLPYISMNEINFVAFDYVSEEFHQELYAHIEISWAGVSDGNKMSRLINYVFGKKNLQRDSYIQNLVDKYNAEVTNESEKIDYNTNKFIPADKPNVEYDYIPTCVRNSIDHPGDENKHWKQSKIVALSIKILLEFDRILKNEKNNFIKEISKNTDLDSYGEKFACSGCSDDRQHSIVFWVDYAIKHPDEKIIKKDNGKEKERNLLNAKFLFEAKNALKNKQGSSLSGA